MLPLFLLVTEKNDEKLARDCFISKKSITFVKIWNTMAVDLKQQLKRVAAKADLVVTRCRRLEQQKTAAEQRIAELESSLADAQLKIEQLTLDNEYLRVASIICPDRTQVEKVRSLISGLVRDIDRCILDLKE